MRQPEMNSLSILTQNGRLRIVVGHCAAFILTSTTLRVLLAFLFIPTQSRSASEIIKALAVGVHLDLATALLLSSPIAWWCLWRSSTPWGADNSLRRLGILLWLPWTIVLFVFAAEGFFFEEFRSRYNTVAVDYIIYPHEVFVNIWESYPVVWIVAACGLSASLIIKSVHSWSLRSLATTPSQPPSPQRPLAAAWFAVSAAVALTVSIDETRFSSERTINEVSSNTYVSFLTAVFTRNLEYSHFYPTLPRNEAFQHARNLLIPGASAMTNQLDSIERTIPGDPSKPRLNMILLLEESLGSEFWGVLGRTNSLTPRMDEISRNEGWLFDNLYADGNRTIRGYEGVFSSFPPLPGDSIVARDRSENVETIARVLGRDGYDTTFIYAGRGVFDGTKKFMTANGWQHFLELKDFINPVFSTVWGVSNEDLYDRAIEEARARHQKGQPFFLTTMSVSNHKPFTYPPGRIPEDPNQRRRDNAVKYTDYALGQFFDKARKEAFWTNTIFCVIADHGARVYGRQTIPIKSYEIPFVVVGPAVISQPKRIPTLGCQLDVAPTLLGLIGRPYQSTFFGQNLLSDIKSSRVLMNHNRSIGIYSDERLVTFSLMNKIEYYAGNPKLGTLERTSRPDDRMKELEKDAIALFQVGDDLYMNRRYRVAAPVNPLSQRDHDHDHDHDHNHEHTAPHGGTLVVLGRETHHLELVLDREQGRLDAYVLDGHAENFVRVATQSFVVEAEVGNTKETLRFLAVENKATGETVGDTSQFQASAEWIKSVRSFNARLVSLPVRGSSYTNIGFEFPKGNE